MAISELLEAFEAHPTDHRAFEVLVRSVLDEEAELGLPILFERLPTWVSNHARSPLIRVIVQLARAEPNQRSADLLYHHLGLLYWQQFGEEQKAEATFRKIKGPPPDASILRSFYLQYYVAQRQWRRLEQFLNDASRGGLGDPIEVKRTLGRLALEHEQDERAIGFWQGLRAQVPEDQEAREALESLYEAAGRWHAVVDLLNEDVDRYDTDAPRMIETLRRIVEIYENHLDAPAKALAAWQALLDVDPHHFEAMDALATAYEALGRWPDLARILEQKADSLPDIAEQLETRRKLARLMLNRFASSSEAVRHYEALLTLEPFDAEALSELKRLHLERHDHEAYVQLSRRELEALPVNLQEVPLRELCRYATKRLRQTNTPRQLWESLLAQQPEDLESLRALSTIYQRSTAHEALSKVWADLSRLEPEKAARVTCLEKLALLCQRRLHDEGRAAHVWGAILGLDADHSRAHAELRKHFITTRDWVGMEAYFREHASLEEWARTLESELKHLDEPEERITLLMTAAAVWSDELQEGRRAVRCLEAVLDIDAHHQSAANALVEQYEALSMAGRLPRVLDILLIEREGEERQTLLMAKAKVLADHFNDWPTAMELLREAASCSALTHPILDRLIEAATRLNQWGVFIEIVEANYETALRPIQIASLTRIGQTYRDHLNDTQRAVETFTQLTIIAPDSIDAWRSKLTLHTDLQQWDEVVNVLIILGELSEADEQHALQRRLVEVHRDERGDLEAAEAILMEMVSTALGSVELHHQLWSMLLKREAYAEVAGWVERHRDARAAEGAEADELADLDCQAGMMTYLSGRDVETLQRALTHFEAALGRAPDHGPSIRELEALVSDDRVRRRVCERLDGVYRGRGDWPALADCIELQILDADDKTRASLLSQLVTLSQGALNSPEREWSARLRLINHQPGDEELRQQLLQTAPDETAMAELAAECTRVADACDTPVERGALRRFSGDLYARHLDDPEAAIAQFEQVRAEEPDDEVLLIRLDELYTSLGFAESHRVILERRLELNIVPEQDHGLRVRLADLLAEGLGRQDAAIEVLQEGGPDALRRPELHHRLDELLTLSERWEDLLVLLESLMEDEGPSPARRYALQLRIAGVLLDKLNRPQEAVERYAQILASRPSAPGVISVLEDLWESDLQRGAVGPLLEAHYQRIQDRPRLRRILAARVDHTEDPQQRYLIHRQLAELYATDGEEERQFEHLGRALLVRPDEGEVRSELADLAEALACWSDFAALLERALPSSGHDDSQRAIREQLIALYTSHHRRPVLAIEHLEALLGHDPDRIEWLQEVVELTRGLSKPAALSSALERLLSLSRDDEALAIMVELGELHASDLNMLDRAIMWLQTASDAAPHDSALLYRLHPLLVDAEDWGGLADSMERLLSCERDAERWWTCAEQLAELYEERLDDRNAAIRTWRRLRDSDPTVTTVYEALERLVSEGARWRELDELLSNWQEVSEQPRWMSLQFQRAQLYQDPERLNEPKTALELLIDLLERDDTHEETASALSALQVSSPPHFAAEVFSHLRTLLRRREDWEGLWSAFQCALTAGPSESSLSFEDHVARAELARDNLLDPLREFDALCDAVRERPDDATCLDRLTALATLDPLATRLSGLLLTLGDDDANGEHRYDLLHRSAAVLTAIGQSQSAIEIYGRLCDDHPDDLVTLTRLAEAYRGSGDWEALSSILARLIALNRGDARAYEWLVERAAVAEERLALPECAVDCWAELLDAQALQDEALRNLLRLASQGVQPTVISDLLTPRLRDAEAFEDLRLLWIEEHKATEDREARFAISMNLGSLCSQRLMSADEGLEWYADALRLFPDHHEALDALMHVAEQAALWQELADSLEAIAEVTDTSTIRHMLREQVASVAANHLDDLTRAEALLRAVLVQSPERGSAWEALDQVLVMGERLDALPEVLTRRIELEDDGEVVNTLRHRLGALGWRTLGLEESDWLNDERLTLDEKHQACLQETIEVYTTLLSTRHDDALALIRLEQLHGVAGAWSAVLDLCQRQAALADSDVGRVGHLERALVLSRRHLSRPELSIALTREILTIRPSALNHLRGLQGLLEETSNHAELHNALQAELPWVTEDVERLLTLYRAMARLCEGPLARPEEAITCWEQLASLSPIDREALEALNFAYASNERFDRLAKTLQAQLVTEHYGSEKRVALWTQLGDLYLHKLDSPERAMTAWENALREDPGAAQAIEALHQLYRASRRWDPLAALIKAQVARIDDPQGCLSWWLELADLQGEALQDWDAAAGTYRVILEAFPEHEDAFKALESIYQRRGQWLQLYELWRGSVERLSSGERFERITNMAELAEVELEDRTIAFDLWRRATGLRPLDLRARQAFRRLGDLLERLEVVVSAHEVQLDGLVESEGEDLALYVAQLCRQSLADTPRAIVNLLRVTETFNPRSALGLTELVDCYRHMEDWAPMGAAIERLASLTEDTEARRDYWVELATLYASRLDAPEDAITAWQKVLAQNAEDLQALATLGGLFEQVARWEEALAVWLTVSKLHPEKTIELDVRRAHILEGHLNQAEPAIALLQDVLTRKPNEIQALELMTTLLSESERHAELMDYLEAAFDAEGERSVRLSWALRCAALAAKPINDPDAATDWLSRALELDPDHAQARRELVALYEGRGQWEELLSMQRQVAVSAENPDTRADALIAVGDLLNSEAKDVDGAITAYESALDIDPTRLDALQHLDTLYEEDGRSMALIERLRAALDHVQDSDQRFGLLFRWGQVAGHYPQMVPDAFAAFRAALQLCPSDDATVDALLALARRSRRDDEILEFLSLKLQLEPDDAVQARLHLELNRYWGARGDDKKAHMHLESAHRLAPSDRTVTEPLIHSLIRLEQWPRAHDLLRTLLSETDQAPTAELWDVMARCAAELNDIEGALNAAQRALHDDDQHLERLETVMHLLVQTERWTEALKRLDQLLEHPGASWSRERRLTLALERSRCAVAANQRPRAAQGLLEVMEAYELPKADSERIAEELEGMACWTQAVSARRRIIALTTAADMKANQLAQIASLYRTQLDDPQAALEAMRQSLEVGGFDMKRALTLVDIATSLSDYAEAIHWLSRCAEAAPGDEARADLQHRIAIHYAEDLRDPAAAAMHLNKELDLAPTRLESFAILDATLTGHRDWRGLERAYRKMLERALTEDGFGSRSTPLLFTLYRNLGEIYRSRLRQPEHAIAAFEAAIGYRPGAIDVREILIGLYHDVQDGDDKRVPHLKALISAQPARFDRYRHLFNVLVADKRADEAWCVAGLLNGLGRASRQEARFYNTYLEPLLPEVTEPLPRDLWTKCLPTSTSHELLGRLFSLLTSALGDELAGLNAPSGDEQQLKHSSRTLLATTLRRVTELMGVAEPPVLRSPGAGVRLSKSIPPALVIGTDMDAGHSQKELAFMLSKQVALLHPTRAPAVLLQTSQLAQLLAAAQRLATPKHAPSVAPPMLSTDQAQQWRRAVMTTHDALERRLSSDELGPIRAALEQLEQTVPLNDAVALIQCIQGWQKASELTCNHIALLVCGDIALALRLLKREVASESVVDRDAKLHDVVHYVLSKPFLEARTALNLAIDRGERTSADS